MTKEEAKHALMHTLEDEVKLSTQKWVQKVEEDARQVQKKNLFKFWLLLCSGILLIK